MEDVIFKVVGFSGIAGLISMAGRGIYNAYKEELKGPRMVIYHPTATEKKEDKEISSQMNLPAPRGGVSFRII